MSESVLDMIALHMSVRRAGAFESKSRQIYANALWFKFGCKTDSNGNLSKSHADMPTMLDT